MAFQLGRNHPNLTIFGGGEVTTIRHHITIIWTVRGSRRTQYVAIGGDVTMHNLTVCLEGMNIRNLPEVVILHLDGPYLGFVEFASRRPHTNQIDRFFREFDGSQQFTPVSPASRAQMDALVAHRAANNIEPALLVAFPNLVWA